MTRTSITRTIGAGLIAAGVVSVAGCGRVDLGEVSDGTSATASADVVVRVTMSPTTCEVSQTAMDRGRVAFVVTNEGTETGRFEVFSGGVDRIGEIRGLASGATRTLLLDSVIPGDYVAACTAGGDEIRHAMRAGHEPL